MRVAVSKYDPPLSMDSHSTTNLATISAVKSVSSLTTSRANLGPLSILKLVLFFMATSLRFLRSTTTFASGCVLVCEMMRSWSRVKSLIEAACIGSPHQLMQGFKAQDWFPVPS